MTDKLLSVPPGGACTMYIDSPGGSPYCAMSLMTLIVLRGLEATASSPANVCPHALAVCRLPSAGWLRLTVCSCFIR